MANRDLVGSGGEVMSALAVCGSVGEMRAMAPLPQDAQMLIDDEVLAVGRERLVLVDDLLNEGLSKPLPNWLSVMEIGHYRTNDVGFAERTMDIDVRDERAVPQRDRRVIPVYATHEGFSFGARELAASQRIGEPLDTTMVGQATRNVNLAIEDQAWNGAGINVRGNGVPGVLTSPVNEFPYTGSNPAWDHASKTGDEIVSDVLGMIAMLKAHRKYGPYNLYIPTDYATALNKNYSDGVTTFDQTIRERLEKIVAGGRPLRIREADLLTGDKTVMLQPTRDVLDVIVGQTPTSLSWLNGNGFRRFFMVLACIIVRIKEDYEGQSGIVVGDVP